MMKPMKYSSIAALLAAGALVACEAADEPLPTGEETATVTEAVVETPPVEEVEEAVVEASNTIVAVAAGTDDLSTLVAAVTAAELVDTLNSDGPFTVFAPPNSAFEKLPEGTVASLLEPDQKDALTGILTYHVVAGEVMAADLVAAIGGEEDGTFEITTVNGAILTASIVDGAPILTDAAGNTSSIIATDIDASNGVVHLIDTVVMPG
ncbi:MAG: fasciclin domain-containing protein [Pseudomonadota bacterium]